MINTSEIIGPLATSQDDSNTLLFTTSVTDSKLLAEDDKLILTGPSESLILKKYDTLWLKKTGSVSPTQISSENNIVSVLAKTSSSLALLGLKANTYYKYILKTETKTSYTFQQSTSSGRSGILKLTTIDSTYQTYSGVFCIDIYSIEEA